MVCVGPQRHRKKNVSDLEQEQGSFLRISREQMVLLETT